MLMYKAPVRVQGFRGDGSETGSIGDDGVGAGVEGARAGAGVSDLIPFSKNGASDATGVCEDCDSPGGEAKDGS